jgi:hypothetical protein
MVFVILWVVALMLLSIATGWRIKEFEINSEDADLRYQIVINLVMCSILAFGIIVKLCN